MAPARALGALVLLLASCASPAAGMGQLYMLTDKGLSGMGAVCLDGTPAAFCHWPASDPRNTYDWHIQLNGGGWCYDAAECYQRTTTIAGSSSAFIGICSEQTGMMSNDCDINPEFCGFNRVIVMNCDSTSFSSDRDDPVVANPFNGTSKNLYFRGRRILVAVLQSLLPLGLNRARRILFTGGSAGGLAAILHADFVREWLTNASVPFQKFGVVPYSGFFLKHSNFLGQDVYPVEMKSMYETVHSVVNRRCVDALGPEAWRCVFAEVALEYVESPIFVINSAMDSFSTMCLYSAELSPGFPQDTTLGNFAFCNLVDHPFSTCAVNPNDCQPAEFPVLNKFLQDFGTVIAAGGTLRKPGNGAFIHSCFTHVEAMDAWWWTHLSVGGVVMRDAVSKWWNSTGEPASAHSHISVCDYSPLGVRGCEASCYGPSAQPATTATTTTARAAATTASTSSRAGTGVTTTVSTTSRTTVAAAGRIAPVGGVTCAATVLILSLIL